MCRVEPFTSTSGSLLGLEGDAGRGVVWATGYGWCAVNDVAIAQARSFDCDDIDPIRKDAPKASAEPKVDLGPLLEVGLSLCEHIEQYPQWDSFLGLLYLNSAHVRLCPGRVKGANLVDFPTQTNINGPHAYNWGSRGRRFKSCQPDWGVSVLGTITL